MKTGIKVCDAMTRKPIAVSPDMSVRECAQLMKTQSVGSLVVKEGEALAGLITDEAMTRNVIAEELDLNTTKALDIMKKDITTVNPSVDIHEALMKMKDFNAKQLPVVDGEKLVGLLTLKDVMKIEPQLFELLVDKINIREEKKKPVFMKPVAEGICELCGEYKEKVTETKGNFVCDECKAL
jgi:CBS domain-containing protein